MIRQARLDSAGLVYALISGAITSGLGYVIWYLALSDLKASSAATVQLSVPVLAATGVILSAVYMLSLVQRVFWNPLVHEENRALLMDLKKKWDEGSAPDRDAPERR